MSEINKVTVEISIASLKLQQLLLEAQSLQDEIKLSIKGEGND